MYPNPNKSGIVNIATTSSAKISSVQVMDIQGKVVQTIKTPASNTIELAKEIANGTYFVKIITNDATYSSTILLNR